MWTVSDRERLVERIHFDIMAALVPNNRFNAVKYLYDRLNILDAKAQGLLTRNGLLLTTVSIVASTQIGKGVPFLYSTGWRLVFSAGFVLLLASTFLTMGIMFLRFDHMTAPPADMAVPNEMQARITRLAALETVPGGPIGGRQAGRTFDDYINAFFEITIRRQISLRYAQRATIAATLLFFAVIGRIFAAAAQW